MRSTTGKKRSFYLFFILFYAVGFNGSALELKTDKPVFDMGNIREGQNIPVHFTVKNDGDDTAKITEIRTFGACVQRRPLDKTSLAPGEILVLDYLFASKGYGGITVDSNIEVHYDSPELSPLLLRVRGQVLPLENHQAALEDMVYNYSILIDMRTPEKFQKEHILGAINLPVEGLLTWVLRQSKNFSEDIIVYLCCEEGSESDKMAENLHRQGFHQFVSLVGGLEEWKIQYGKRLLVSGPH